MEIRENKQQSVRRCKRDRAMLVVDKVSARVCHNVHRICGLRARKPTNQVAILTV